MRDYKTTPSFLQKQKTERNLLTYGFIAFVWVWLCVDALTKI